jgi:methyl acetate hydrolase
MTDSSLLDASLREPVERGLIPFVSAIAVNHDGVVYEGAFGEARPGTAMRVDSIVRIASMTKALTSLCAVQLVERGTLSLDRPASQVLPEIADTLVLEGVILRKPSRPMTLRHLLTHTSGYAYPFTSPELHAYLAATPGPGGQALETPLVCDPGERWQYGVGIDWAGLMVEAASGLGLDDYMERNVLRPLGMIDTAFALPDEKMSRLTSLCARLPDGDFADRGITPPIGRNVRDGKSFVSGGAGLTSTAIDYGRFLRFMLCDGELDGVRLLGAQGFEGMVTNQIGSLVAGSWTSPAPETSYDLNFTDGATAGHTLGFLITGRDGPTGRAAGTLRWAGIFNSYYWIDRANDVAGATFCQFLPFLDPVALAVHEAFQSAVYRKRCDE